MDLIRRNVVLSSRPMPTEEDLFNQSEVWAEELFSTVPEIWLEASFAQAFKDHDNAFPLTAFDVKKGYHDAEREERIADYRRREAEMDDLDRKNRLAIIPVCEVCRSTGYKDAGTRESFMGRSYPGVERSYGCCDYWERRRQNNERGRMDKIDKG